MKAINITAYTEDSSQIEIIKAVIKALKIKYSINTVEEPEVPYNVDFVKKIKKSQAEVKEGKTTRVKKEDLEQFLGL